MGRKASNRKSEIATAELFHLWNNGFTKDNWSESSLTSKIKQTPKSTTHSCYKHKQLLKIGRELIFKNNPKLKHDPKNNGSKRFKTTLKSWGGPKFEKIGENSCSCNNWRLPGEPRSLEEYSLSDRLFNNKWTYWILPAIWISRMATVCSFNHWW